MKKVSITVVKSPSWRSQCRRRILIALLLLLLVFSGADSSRAQSGVSSGFTCLGDLNEDGKVNIFDLATRQTTDLGEILTHKVFGGPERTWRTVPRALYCDLETGIVYTSGDNGVILRYHPGADSLALSFMRLPGEYWEGLKFWDYPVVEALDTDRAGRPYAATSDGFLVRIDLKTEKLAVLGKPRIMRRMRAMAIGQDDKFYMISGEPERMCKLHTYDLSGQEGFQEMGTFAVDRSPYYSWRAYQFDAIAIGPDGAVFCGESDRRGKLFIYVPGPRSVQRGAQSHQSGGGAPAAGHAGPDSGKALRGNSVEERDR